MMGNKYIALGFTIVGLLASYSLPLLAQDFTVVELRKAEVNFYDIDGKVAGELSRSEIGDRFGEIAVIGYTPERMLAQIVIPGHPDENIFVMANDIEVTPPEQWRNLTMATVDIETVCLSDGGARTSPPGPNESTHAAHALFSCR